MRATRMIVTLGAAGVIALAGCGGGDDDGDAAGTGATRPTEQAEGPQATFAATCGGCHTLQAAGTSGSIGPDLDELQPDAARVQEAIETGPGTMPENLLTGEDAQAVAQYVADNAGQ